MLRFPCSIHPFLDFGPVVQEATMLPLLQSDPHQIYILSLSERGFSLLSSKLHLSLCEKQTGWWSSGWQWHLASSQYDERNPQPYILAWAKKHEQRTLDRWKYQVWWVQIWDFWFQQPCLCEMQSRWTDDLRMCGSHREAWRRMMWWCGGALLVTLSAIYLEFKAHLTSMATTVFCSDTPSHLVCA